jgi:hypothetical protein
VFSSCCCAHRSLEGGWIYLAEGNFAFTDTPLQIRKSVNFLGHLKKRVDGTKTTYALCTGIVGNVDCVIGRNEHCAISFTSLCFVGRREVRHGKKRPGLHVREITQSELAFEDSLRAQRAKKPVGLEEMILTRAKEEVKMLAEAKELTVATLDEALVRKLTLELFQDKDFFENATDLICADLRKKLLDYQDVLFAKVQKEGSIVFRNSIFRDFAISCTTDFVDITFRKCGFEAGAIFDVKPIEREIEPISQSTQLIELCFRPYATYLCRFSCDFDGGLFTCCHEECVRILDEAFKEGEATATKCKEKGHSFYYPLSRLLSTLGMFFVCLFLTCIVIGLMNL